MSFVWTLPGRLPDRTVLNRMRQNFPEPTEPMREPWFMSGEINYWTVQEFDAQSLEHTIDQSASGIRCFPETSHAPIWKAWILYLLRYALVCEKEKGKFNYLIPSVIGGLITLYPDEITEEYPGFRYDIIHAICARVFPRTLTRGNPKPNRENIPIVNDIWGDSFYLSDQPNPLISVPILFCLKYLQTTEIEEWAKSLFGIKSVQFYLEFVIWWQAFNKFQKRAQTWPKGGKVSDLLKATELASMFFLPTFASFDAFIPSANLTAFKRILEEQLTADAFQHWSADIKANADYYLSEVELTLQLFEDEFFGQPDA